MTRMYLHRHAFGFAHQALTPRRIFISALMIVGITASGCTTNYLTNSTQGTYGVPVSERTIPQRLLDRSIEHTAKINVYGLQDNLQQNSRISIDSFYSHVLLSGEVPSEALKIQVEKVISSMPDVRRVYNELNVGIARGYSSTVQDGYVTSKIMAKVAANNSVKASQTKTVTNNGVVYVMGRVTPTQQSHLIDIANSTAGVTELVLLTTLIDDRGAPISEEDIMSEQVVKAAPATSADTTGATTTDEAAPITLTPEVRKVESTQGTSSGYIDLYKTP